MGDLLCLLINTWLMFIFCGKKAAFYKSDISGAFDRVYTAFLLAKLRSLGIPDNIVEFLQAYLAPRIAHVAIGGVKSDDFCIQNSVYQGTVLGPMLWNTFFMDVAFAARSGGGNESLFADDLSVFKAFDRFDDEQHIFSDIDRTRRRVHAWGSRNRVSFDPAKEQVSIMHPLYGTDENFTFLGVIFDTNMSMHSDIDSLLRRCRPKVHSILRAQRYYSVAQSINLFKTHIWGVIEYHTAAIFHSCDTLLNKLDDLQARFCDKLNISTREAFLNFNFAPLYLRRNIAMLAVLHKRVHNQCHPAFHALFPFAETLNPNYHDKQLSTRFPRAFFQPTLFRRSIFTLTYCYNRLPQRIVDLTCTSDFSA